MIGLSMSSHKQHERTQARRRALQIMYQGEILETAPLTLIDDKRLVEGTDVLDDYTLSLLEGCNDYASSIDAIIGSTSENWSIDRMPLVDKSLIRLATYEMKYVSDVPISVSINEAVNLAKEFGGDDSPRFVNGVLGRIADQLEGSQDDANN